MFVKQIAKRHIRGLRLVLLLIGFALGWGASLALSIGMMTMLLPFIEQLSDSAVFQLIPFRGLHVMLQLLCVGAGGVMLLAFANRLEDYLLMSGVD